MSRKRLVAVTGLAAAGLLAIAVAVAAPANAETVDTPIGQLTGTAGELCNDFGATVPVGVTGGLPNTVYKFSPPHADGPGVVRSVTLTTDASGAGSATLYAVRPEHGFKGTAIVVVTAGRQAAELPVEVDCYDSKGD